MTDSTLSREKTTTRRHVVSFIGNEQRSNSVRRWLTVLLGTVGFMVLAGCVQQSEPTSPRASEVIITSLPQLQPANVEAIDINQTASFPVEVSVTVRGNQPNACVFIDQIRQERNGSDFKIVIESLHQGNENCGSERVPFEETINLDVSSLPAGIYVIDVNGLKGTFKIKTQNVADPENAVLGGLLWLDVCSPGVDETSTSATFEAGCIDQGDGNLRPNGIADESETGLGGVIVNLGAGSCPSIGLATTITDGQGRYLFGGLKEGTYCISIDGAGPQNSAILLSGDWTSPLADSAAEISTDLSSEESKLDINFGWNYALSPLILPREDPCTDKALFISDVSIPDDTLIGSEEPFTKTWQLRNIGSCSWGVDYSLVFFDGDPMNGSESIPFEIEILPGDDVELSVELSAPVEPGNYQSAWKLQNADGNLFGIGPGSDRAFWVQIIVDE